MDQSSELISILNESFQWNKARITCFVQMLIALLKTETVNLTKIALYMSGGAQQESRYRRVTRFFANYFIDFDMIASFILDYFLYKAENGTSPWIVPIGSGVNQILIF
jgi:hypothetical protein